MRQIAWAIVLAASNAAYAQKGLAVNNVFEGRIVPHEKMIEAEVRGSQLKAYNLTHFRSVKMHVAEEERAKVEETVVPLLATATELEQEKKGGRLYYAVMMLPADKEGQTKRFVCYQCPQDGKGGYNITLVYMEGSATLEQLRKTFKKNN